MKDWGEYSDDLNTFTTVSSVGPSHTYYRGELLPSDPRMDYSLSFTIKTHYEGLTDAIHQAIHDTVCSIMSDFIQELRNTEPYVDGR